MSPPPPPPVKYLAIPYPQKIFPKVFLNIVLLAGLGLLLLLLPIILPSIIVRTRCPTDGMYNAALFVQEPDTPATILSNGARNLPQHSALKNANHFSSHFNMRQRSAFMYDIRSSCPILVLTWFVQTWLLY